MVALSVEFPSETPDWHINCARVREIVVGSIREEPSEEDMECVSCRLEEGGWSLTQSDPRDRVGRVTYFSRHIFHPN